MLQAIHQRIVGVLVEKALAVPESYPLTLNALVAGCNQKSNRDPEMALESLDVEAAVHELMADGWITRVEGSRAPRYRVEIETKLAIDPANQAILAELLVRGPQAPGALKPRIARLGASLDPTAILDRLKALRERELTEQLPRRHRERDWRWAHCLGPRDEADNLQPPPGAAAHPERYDFDDPPAVTDMDAPPRRATPPAPATAGADDLPARVAALERTVEELRAEVENLRRVIAD